MKILFDHCVPRPFRNAFPSHDIKTTSQMGWQDLQNGRLLKAASQVFEVVLTVDKRMKFEQNLKTLPVSVIVLDAVMNTPEALLPFAPFVETVLPTLLSGQMVEIDASGKVTVIVSGLPR